MAEILRRLCACDDLISGGPTTVSKGKKLKNDVISIFADGGFQLQKWHSNAPELERGSQGQPAQSENAYAKLQLGSASVEGRKLLGLDWNKAKDTLSVSFP